MSESVLRITSASVPEMLRADVHQPPKNFDQDVIDSEILSYYNPREIAKSVDAVINNQGEGFVLRRTGRDQVVDATLLLSRAESVQQRAQQLGKPTIYEKVGSVLTALSGAVFGSLIHEVIQVDETTATIAGGILTSLATVYKGHTQTYYTRAHKRLRKQRSANQNT